MSGRAQSSLIRLSRVPLAGGTAGLIDSPVSVQPDTRRDFAVIGPTVYFLRPVPDPPPLPSAPAAKRKGAAVELLAVPLKGGRTTLVKKFSGILSMLYASRGRLYLIAARPDDPTRVDLHHADPARLEWRTIADFESWLPPVMAGDRLCWITRRYVRRDPRMAGVTLETSELVSAKLDGSDRQTIAKVVDGGIHYMPMGRPVVHKNRVYALVSDPETEVDGMSRQETLYRVRTDQTGLEKVADLPRSAVERFGFVDGDWYYFLVNDRRQGWLDYVRDSGNAKFVNVLHRLKLPD